MQSELLDPLIERAFHIMDDMGLIPPAPAIMQDMEMDVVYISILASAQRMVGLTAIEQQLDFTVRSMQVDPEAGDNFDADEASSVYGDLSGLPARIVRPRAKVAERRRLRAEQMAKQQDAEAAARAAQIGSQAAKNLADTELGTNSALDALLGPTGPK